MLALPLYYSLALLFTTRSPLSKQVDADFAVLSAAAHHYCLIPGGVCVLCLLFPLVSHGGYAEPLLCERGRGEIPTMGTGTQYPIGTHPISHRIPSTRRSGRLESLVATATLEHPKGRIAYLIHKLTRISLRRDLSLFTIECPHSAARRALGVRFCLGYGALPFGGYSA
jgi:hypothetical protein